MNVCRGAVNSYEVPWPVRWFDGTSECAYYGGCSTRYGFIPRSYLAAQKTAIFMFLILRGK